MDRGDAVDLLLSIDAAAYGGRTALSFDRHEVATLLERFPDAVTIVAVDGVPVGYVSAFPIAPTTAARLIRAPARDDFAFPCTSHDPARALFLTSDVPSEADVVTLDTVAWYVDSVAASGAPSASGLARGAILRAAAAAFDRWRRRLPVTRVLTVTVTDRGEKMVRRMTLDRFGFGAFESLWTHAARDCTCWMATALRPARSAPAR